VHWTVGFLYGFSSNFLPLNFFLPVERVSASHLPVTQTVRCFLAERIFVIISAGNKPVSREENPMNETIRTNLNNLWSTDRQLQNEAFFYILNVTDKPVDWAYDVWEEIVENLSHKDNHNRAIAAQILCSLAKSDPQDRLRKDFKILLAVTKDERFVTARHCMQSLWKVGIAGNKQQKMVVDGLSIRFSECIAEKNCTLIRFDIIQCLRNVYEIQKEENVRQKALELIETEDDLKYRKKYASLWKK
jgi:hypothetical protein